MIGLVGFTLIVTVSWALSESRKNISWTFCIKAIALQFFVAYFSLKISFLSDILSPLNTAVIAIQEATNKSSEFLFGYIGGAPAPFVVSDPGNNFVVAFRVLPLIIVVSSLSAVLFHWRIIPFLISLLSKILTRTLGISGALGLGSAATVFLGTIESPLIIRPYLQNMPRSDLFALVSCSMATISGTVLVLYSSVLSQIIPNASVHLLIASVMSVPAALLISRLMIPEDRTRPLAQDAHLVSDYDSTTDALLRGTSDGLAMVLNIVAIILVFFAIAHLVNFSLSVISPNLTVQFLLGKAFRPIMYLIGISWPEAELAGQLMGTKIVLNEFVAYSEMVKSFSAQSEQTKIVLTYAMCGFANFASVGIIAGGLSAILPTRKKEVMSLSIKGLISGNLATLMTAAVASLLI